MAYTNERLLVLQPPKHDPPLSRQHRLINVSLKRIGLLYNSPALDFTPGKEDHALVAHHAVHAAKCFVEDDQVRVLDDGAEEEGNFLRGERDVPKTDLVGPVVVDLVVGYERAYHGWGVERIIWAPLNAFEHKVVDMVGRGVEGGVELCSEPAKASVDFAVSFVGEYRFAEEGVRPGVFERLANGESAREEGVDFR